MGQTESYFLCRKYERYMFVKNLVEFLYQTDPQKFNSFISIGCDTAGEESFLVRYFSNSILLDIDSKAINFAKEAYKKSGMLQDKLNYKFVCADYRSFDHEDSFDVIYSSSLTDWMTDVNNFDLITFTSQKLSKDGIAVFRLYGAQFGHKIATEKFRCGDYFVKKVDQYCQKVGLKVTSWDYRDREYWNQKTRKIRNNHPSYNYLQHHEHNKGRQQIAMMTLARIDSQIFKSNHYRQNCTEYFDKDNFLMAGQDPAFFNTSGKIENDRIRAAIQPLEQQITSFFEEIDR